MGLHKQGGQLPGREQLVAGTGPAQGLPVLLPQVGLERVHGVMCLQCTAHTQSEADPRSKAAVELL